MKLPLSWLREWVDVPWSHEELAHRLTMLGLEVESLATVAPPFSGVVVAEILTAAPHPQADKLRICSVDAGASVTGSLQIVCGAANARAGLKTALAMVGAQLPGDLTIKQARLRGVDSHGMLCSVAELGLPAASEGILELPTDAPVGADLRNYLDLDDLILELGITPNRGDAMSVQGVAREIAAASGQPLRQPTIKPVAITGSARFPVTLEAGAGAGRFASRVISGVDNRRPTPAWMRERLQRAGLRSISPIVDVTNYVLLELGQPLHAYDLGLLQHAIHVRRAREREAVRLLDGRDLQLDADVLTITDSQGIVGLAGIMGGERTAISPTTSDLLLEVAWFAPAAIAGRARRYGLLTDASQRFERGVDPTLQERALERASALILELAGGQAGPIDLQQCADLLPGLKPVTLRATRLQQLLGAPAVGEKAPELLAALGMKVEGVPAAWQVTPPPWRFDIGIEADLIEEVARLAGFDTIPETSAMAPQRLASGSQQRFPERAVLQLLAARGFQEVITFGFVDPALQQQLLGDQPAVPLRNPIASDLAVMRASLWPGLIGVARQNQRRQQQRGRLFEIATRFLVENGGTREQKMIAGLVYGERWPEQWGSVKQPVDFFDLKGDVEALLAVGASTEAVGYRPIDQPPPALHPGRCAQIFRGSVTLGVMGELHPALVQCLDLTYAPVLFELDYDGITSVPAAAYKPVSAFPQIRRDISFTVAESESFSRIAEHVSVAASTRLKELRVFDVYQGKGVETGRKSIALGLILQDLSRTLTDKEADDLVAAVVTRLRTHLDAKLRD